MKTAARHARRRDRGRRRRRAAGHRPGGAGDEDADAHERAGQGRRARDRHAAARGLGRRPLRLRLDPAPTGRLVGRMEGDCLAVDLKFEGMQCTLTAVLADGSITLQGASLTKHIPGATAPSQDVYAITGGTGAYLGAAGTMRRSGNGKTDTDVFELRWGVRRAARRVRAPRGRRGRPRGQRCRCPAARSATRSPAFAAERLAALPAVDGAAAVGGAAGPAVAADAPRRRSGGERRSTSPSSASRSCSAAARRMSRATPGSGQRQHAGLRRLVDRARAGDVQARLDRRADRAHDGRGPRRPLPHAVSRRRRCARRGSCSRATSRRSPAGWPTSSRSSAASGRQPSSAATARPTTTSTSQARTRLCVRQGRRDAPRPADGRRQDVARLRRGLGRGPAARHLPAPRAGRRARAGHGAQPVPVLPRHRGLARLRREHRRHVAA